MINRSFVAVMLLFAAGALFAEEAAPVETRGVMLTLTSADGRLTDTQLVRMVALYVPQGQPASALLPDAKRATFDGAADKIEKQLRRYKRRLRDDHTGPNGVAPPEDNAAYVVFEPLADEEVAESDHPVVIAETRVDVPDASVSDAVMMLDLRHTNALLFRNAGTGTYNMVYRRNDGTIGWVEPNRAG